MRLDVEQMEKRDGRAESIRSADAEAKRAERIEAFMRGLVRSSATDEDGDEPSGAGEAKAAAATAAAYTLLINAGFDDKTAGFFAESFCPVFSEPTMRKILRKAARDIKIGKAPNPHEGHRKRLRESVFRDRTLDSFSDVELLETLLSFTVPRKDTNVIAHELLAAHDGSLNAVLKASKEELMSVPSMTEAAAVTITLISILGYCNNRSEARIRNRREAREFFASLFAGGVVSGTYVAYLDDGFRLVALEKHGDTLDPVAAVGGLHKHSASYLFIGKNDEDIFTRGFNDMKRLRDLIFVSDAVEAVFMDYFLFTPLGYYSLGEAAARVPDDPIFVFTPTVTAARSQELTERALRDLTL